MLHAPLVEPAKDMSANLDNPSSDGLIVGTHSSEEPPARNTTQPVGGAFATVDPNHDLQQAVGNMSVNLTSGTHDDNTEPGGADHAAPAAAS